MGLRDVFGYRARCAGRTRRWRSSTCATGGISWTTGRRAHGRHHRSGESRRERGRVGQQLRCPVPRVRFRGNGAGFPREGGRVMEQDVFASLRALRESPPPGGPPPGTEIVIDRVLHIDASLGQGICRGGSGRAAIPASGRKSSPICWSGSSSVAGSSRSGRRDTSCWIAELAAMASEVAESSS